MDFPFTRIKGGVGAPLGFLTSAVSCGIKNPAAERLDLALIYSEQPCSSAGAFTTNRVKAAPVRVSHAHLRKGDLRAIIANSGNANACTGVQGIRDANAMCDAVAKPLGLKRTEIGVSSTGVIGLPMPMLRVDARKPPRWSPGWARKTVPMWPPRSSPATLTRRRSRSPSTSAITGCASAVASRARA